MRNMETPVPQQPPPLPVGEDNWVAYVEEQGRAATNLDTRVQLVELFQRAVSAEPGSIKVWLAYCEYFWSLHTDCQPHSDAGWPVEEQAAGHEIFSLDAALNLWQQGHEATRYRLSDSHHLWNRWISLEMELLAKTRTPEGVRRITHLFRNRLLAPHATWEDTSQMFSSFLSEYNRAAWEDTMKDITERAVDARRIYELRDRFEMACNVAARAGSVEEQKAALNEYLDWEMHQSTRVKEHEQLNVEISFGLFSRALTGICSTDESVWADHVAYVSGLHTVYNGKWRSPDMISILPNLLDILQRAVQHCPWSGPLWARYILAAEDSGLAFQDIERIKHAATNSQDLDKDGMTGVFDMYVAWCGYLKRKAMHVTATEDDVDIADVGLTTALEDVSVWGKRRYKEEYKGDPSFRLERILIQYLTENKGAIDDARKEWEALARRDLYRNSYDFWLQYYKWEMLVFQAEKGKVRSPTPVSRSKNLRVPTLATEVLTTAVLHPGMDWPERILEVYLQHCNDYESPDTLRHAVDTVHQAKKDVAKRREREAADAAAAYAAQVAQYGQATAPETQDSPSGSGSGSGSKRKREVGDDDAADSTGKRVKNQEVNGAATASQDPPAQQKKRDRENTSIMVTNLPAGVTQTKVRQYFREYGHVNNLTVKNEADGQSALAMIEFRSPDEVLSAQLRDGKYFGQQQISVTPATGLTLFVTNYPPRADEAYIGDLFKECGDIFSIRWPSLKYNTHRRFCYVSFREPEAAARATRLDGKLLEGRFKLEAKVSDPSHRKKREGALEEGREVHVANLDTEAREDEVKEMFGKYGNVASVRILRNQAGKSRGSGFVVMATKEEAEKAAAELDKTKFRNQILQVDMSTAANVKMSAKSTGGGAAASPSPAPSGPDAEGDDDAMADRDDDAGKGNAKGSARDRSFSLLGIPDTVNDTRVRALVEKYGEVVKIVLRPHNGGAIVEFADAAAAGRAQLSLEGVELDGRKLTTGSVADLQNSRAEQRTDRVDRSAPKPNAKSAVAMMPPPPPPSMIRRPVLGKAGAKRGLGFAPKAVPKTKGGPTTNGGEHVDSKAGPMKSNTEFRAMFLSSGGAAGAKEAEKNGVAKAAADNGTNGNGMTEA